MSNNTDFDRDPPSTGEGNVKLRFYIASLLLGFGGNSLVITVMSRKKTETFDSQTFYSESYYFRFKLHPDSYTSMHQQTPTLTSAQFTKTRIIVDF